MNNVFRTLVYGENVSLTLADTTEIVREGIRRHRLARGSAILFGKTISAMTFASACLKEEKGEISCSLRANGECGEIAVSGDRALSMRGYITNVQIAEERERPFTFGGSLTIVRDDGYSRPFVGTCALEEDGGVDESFEGYYRISEQLPTRIRTIVELDGEGACVFAGVVALQPLPFATADALQKTAALELSSVLSKLKTLGGERTIEETFGRDERAWDARCAAYRCKCSREYLSRVLVTLGEEQFREILREDGAVRLHCHYCNTDYAFTEEDAARLFPKK